MADTSIFDLSFILTSVADDRELATEVIGVFLMDIPVQLEALDRAIAGGDAPTAQRAAHSIKGAAATVGAEQLRAIAYEGEILGRDGKLDELKALAGEIRAKFNATEEEMRKQGFEPME